MEVSIIGGVRCRRFHCIAMVTDSLTLPILTLSLSSSLFFACSHIIISLFILMKIFTRYVFFCCFFLIQTAKPKIGDKINVEIIGQDEYGRYMMSSKTLLSHPAPDTQQDFDRELLNSKISMASDMPGAEHNFEIGSELEVVVVCKLHYGFRVELAPGVTSLLHRSHIYSHVCCLIVNITDDITSCFSNIAHILNVLGLGVVEPTF